MIMIRKNDRTKKIAEAVLKAVPKEAGSRTERTHSDQEVMQRLAQAQQSGLLR
jgi:hypothetical protein